MIEQIEGGDGVVKVVSAGQVEHESLMGFKLIGIYQEGDYTSVSEQVPDPNGGYSGATMGVTKYVPTSETFFVMRKDEKSALADMKKSVDFAREKQREAENAFAEKEKEAKDYQERLEGQARTIERHGRDLMTCQENRNRLQDSNTKMEKDLGKLREAIGTKQFNEILGREG